MMVTGVQAVGSKGVTAIQGAVVDTSDATRSGPDREAEAKRAGWGAARAGIRQPVVFPRQGVPVDQRPVAMRHKQEAIRYRTDGGNHDEAA